MNAVTIARIQAKAVLPAMLVATYAEGVMADKATPAAIAMNYFTDQTPALPRAAMDEAESQQTRTYSAPATEWTRAMAKRFRELAKKEALDTIAPREMEELERLTQERRILKFPRPADEVLWELNQRRVTADLIGALNKYVQFHQRAH